MKFAEVHAALRVIANGRFFSVALESSENRRDRGRLEMGWRCYIGAGVGVSSGKSIGWSDEHTDPKRCLAEMAAKSAGTWVEPGEETVTRADLEAVG